MFNTFFDLVGAAVLALMVMMIIGLLTVIVFVIGTLFSPIAAFLLALFFGLTVALFCVNP